ncbi:MAG: lipopolysaccharide biosynthesis protein [Paramuribaculum sp.]|nr:lipopolysaccharide biosynthesis protein [Paramuribaculum sp.]
MSQSLAKTAVKGTIWSSVGKIGVMAIQFSIYVVLARLLTPADFGAIGMLMIFITVSQAFADGGFGSALIQKKDTTQTDYSTVFYWNIGIGTVIFITLYLLAPAISHFYDMPILLSVLRVIAINTILMGVASTQVARLQKQLKFKQLAMVDICTYILSAAISISMAATGFGIWSLVALNLCQNIGKVMMIFIISRWLPNLCFSWTSLKRLFSFGGFHMLSYLIETICNNIQGILIGKQFSASQVGYYSQAARLENLTGLYIPQVIAQVMYPIFSQIQDDKPHLRAIVTADHRIISFLIYPLLTTLIILAPDVIRFIYGNQWEPAVPYYRILMVGGFFLCLKNINSYAVAACGKSKTLFYASIIQITLLAALLYIGSLFGMIGIMWALTINMFNIFISYATASQIHTGLKITSVLRALLPSVLLCLVSAVIIYPLYLFTNIWWPVYALAFIAIYLFTAFAFKVKAFSETKLLLSKLTNKH